MFLISWFGVEFGILELPGVQIYVWFLFVWKRGFDYRVLDFCLECQQGLVIKSHTGLDAFFDRKILS